MSATEHFVPGKWVDTIDVNDFVILNKKPFLLAPDFLEKSIDNEIENYFSSILDAYLNHDFKIHLGFSNFEHIFFNRFDNLKHNLNPFVTPIGYTENLDVYKKFYSIDSIGERTSFRTNATSNFDNIATTDMKKMSSIGLFKNTPTSFSATNFHPDIRIIPLYGTRFLIKEKKWLLKNLEKRLKTNDWIQQRIDICNQISMLEKFERFCSENNTDVSKPAGNSYDVLNMLIVSLTFLFLENPSIPFCFDQIISFFDIFLENDLEDGLIDEKEAQKIIDSFFLQCSLYRFSISPILYEQYKSIPFFFSETLSMFNICKTSYRFLNSIVRFNKLPYHLNLFFDTEEHEDFNSSSFYSYFNEIKDSLNTYSFYNPSIYKTNVNISFDFNGQSYIPSEDLVFDMGSLDLKKLLFISLNGGKDISTNTNITPISQPVRRNDFSYDEIYNKFKDFLIYSINIFSESSYIAQNLLSRSNPHPTRNSLSYHINFFNPQFSFDNLYSCASILSAVKNNDFKVVRNKKGFISSIDMDSNEIDDSVFFDIVELIEKEIKKIPQHKFGEISIRFLNDSPSNLFDFKDIEQFTTIIPELSSSKFSFNLIGTPSIEELLEFSSYGYSCIHLTNPSSLFINKFGVITRK